MVATFLRAELDSPRFREALLAFVDDVALITRPDLDDAEENAARARALDGYRGWFRRVWLFHGFPHDVEWSRVALTRDEVLSILYIDWDWWVEVSAGTRRPLDAARRIRDGLVPGVTAEEHERVAGGTLIVVTNPQRAKFVLVEGHARLTAFALAPQRVPDELEVLLGVSPAIEEWSLF